MSNIGSTVDGFSKFPVRKICKVALLLDDAGLVFIITAIKFDAIASYK